MPTYDYECKVCKYTLEEVLKISDRLVPTQSPCQNCKAENSVSLVLGAPSIGDPVRLGIRKPDSRVTERIEHIKKSALGKT